MASPPPERRWLLVSVAAPLVLRSGKVCRGLMRAATPQLDESEQGYVPRVNYWDVLGHWQIAFGKGASPLEVSSVSGDLGD